MYNTLKLWDNKLKNIMYDEEGCPFILEDEFALMGFYNKKNIYTLKKFINKLWELKNIPIFYNNVKKIRFWYFKEAKYSYLNDIFVHIELIKHIDNEDTISIYYGNSYTSRENILTRKWHTNKIYNHYILENNWKNFKKRLLRVIRNNYYV
jgi:hypothetical protein